MRKNGKKLVVANWKMNPATVGKAKELFLDIRKQSSKRTKVETVIAAPFVYLAELRKLTTGAHTKLGAQDVFWEKEGTYTGEVSAPMLMSVGVSHVIVGHSERRALGETDEQVRKKVVAVLKAGCTAILCVGESERDQSGHHLSVVEEQIRMALKGLSKTMLKNIVVAYEPVWAISTGDGKGKTATPDDVHEMVIFIRRIVTSIFDRASAEHVRILYGGSVNEENALPMLTEGMVDGFLVGGTSLKPLAFGTILKAAHECA